MRWTPISPAAPSIFVATPFSLTSGWKERLRLKAAIDRDMVVLGYDYFPRGHFKSRNRRRGAAPGAGRRPIPWRAWAPYAFLERTSHWSAEEICFAYAMTEPSLCTVQVAADQIDRVEAMAAVCERELPSGVPAQIEMARFGPAAAGATRANRPSRLTRARKLPS